MRPISIPNKNGAALATDNLAFSSSYTSAAAGGSTGHSGTTPAALDESMSSTGAGSLDIEPGGQEAATAATSDSTDGNQRRSSLSLSKIDALTRLESVKEDQRSSQSKTTPPRRRLDDKSKKAVSSSSSRSIKKLEQQQQPVSSSSLAASSTEINHHHQNQLSSTTALSSVATFDISSSLSTESSPLSSDTEDNNNTKSEVLNVTTPPPKQEETTSRRVADDNENNDVERHDEQDSFDEDEEEEEIFELTRDKKLLDKFNSDYDGQVEKIADKACDLVANGSFYDCGLYQFLSFVFLSIVWTVGTGWYAYISVFSGYTPEHQCSMGENYTVPSNESACWAVNIHTNETVECNHWTYDESQMRSTIITDHNFVCSKDYYFELGYTVEQIGYIVGTLIFSYIADVVGRKPVLVATLVSMCVLGFVQYALISSFSIYIALGFVINSLACGLEASCVTLVLEMFSTQKRTVFGIGIEIIWVLVIASMAPMAYVMKDWKEIRLAIFVLLAVLAVLSPWMSQESVRWLISMGKVKPAEKIIDKMIKFNRLSSQVTLPGKAIKTEGGKPSLSQRQKLTRMLDALSLYNKLLAEQKLKPLEQREFTQPSVTTIKSMFSNSKFRLYVLIMALNWFATALVYDGLTYLNNFIGDNIFFSWIVMNLIELPAQFVCYFVISRYGRRLTVSVTLITSGVSLLLTLVDMLPGMSGIEWLKIILFVLAKFTLTQSYSAVILHAPELFPTNMRSFGYGICLFSGKITSVMSPMISMYLGKIAPHLPAFIYGLISILCGLLSLYVPETLNRPLPNSVDDVCKWPRSLTEAEWQVVRDINKAEIDNVVNKLKAIGRKKITETKRKRTTRINPSVVDNNPSGNTTSEVIVIQNDELGDDKKGKYTVIASSASTSSRSSEPSSPSSVKVVVPGSKMTASPPLLPPSSY